MELVYPLATLLIVIVAFRTLFRGLFERRRGADAPDFVAAFRAQQRQAVGQAMLEAAALASLHEALPHGAFGITAWTLVAGCGIAMVLLPGLMRALLGFVLASIAVITAGPQRGGSVLALVGLFLVLRAIRYRVLP